MYPISALDYGAAFLAWFLVSHLLALATIPVALWALRMPLSWRNLILGVLILAISYPFYRSLSAGQLNAPLMFGYALFWLLLTRLREPLRGPMVGFLAAALMLFKLSPGILLIYLLWKRHWREAVWMLFFAVVFSCVTMALFGLERHLAFLPMLRDMGYGRSTWAQFGHAFFSDPYNQSINSLFHHLFARTPATQSPLVYWGPGVANALTWLSSLALLGLTLWLTRRRSEPEQDPALEYSLFIFLSLLLPSLMWDHYLVQLVFPIIAIYRGLQIESSNWRRILPGILLLLGLIVISIPFRLDDERWRAGAGLLVMSLKLWGVTLLWVANLILLIFSRRWSQIR